MTEHACTYDLSAGHGGGLTGPAEAFLDLMRNFLLPSLGLHKAGVMRKRKIKFRYCCGSQSSLC